MNNTIKYIKYKRLKYEERLLINQLNNTSQKTYGNKSIIYYNKSPIILIEVFDDILYWEKRIMNNE